MPRNLNFTESQDSKKRADTYIKFRVDVEQLAAACAEVAHGAERNPRLVSKAEMEKHLRRELWDKGDNAYRWELDPEVEELLTEALDHVKGIYGIER